MSDYGSARIKIGGSIPLPLVAELCTKIKDSNVSLEYNSLVYTPNNRDDLMEGKKENGLLCLYDDQARGGVFEHLEDFLVSVHISFDRHSDALYESSAEWARYRPGIGIEYDYATQEGNYLTITSRITRITRDLRKAYEENSLANIYENIIALERATNLHIEKLSEFIVLDH